MSCILGTIIPLASEVIKPRPSRYACKLSEPSSAGRVKYTKNVPTISPPIEDADTNSESDIPPASSSVPTADKLSAKSNVGASATALISNVKLSPSPSPNVVACVVPPCDVAIDRTAFSVPAVSGGGIKRVPERLKLPFASTSIIDVSVKLYTPGVSSEDRGITASASPNAIISASVKSRQLVLKAPSGLIAP